MFKPSDQKVKKTFEHQRRFGLKSVWTNGVTTSLKKQTKKKHCACKVLQEVFPGMVPFIKLEEKHFSQKKLVLFITLKCLSIGTPKNSKFSICPKWKIHYFQVSQNLGRVQPHNNVLEYWDP